MDSDLLSDYQDFVDMVTSDASKNMDDFGDALDIMDEQGVEPTRLMLSLIHI